MKLRKEEGGESRGVKLRLSRPLATEFCSLKIDMRRRATTPVIHSTRVN